MKSLNETIRLFSIELNWNIECDFFIVLVCGWSKLSNTSRIRFGINEIVDWYESQWWLNATKNETSKWKNGGRNRTKVYIYPSYGIDDPKTTTIRASTSAVITSATNSIAPAINVTTTDDETLIILPGIWEQFILLNVQLNFQLHSITHREI